MVLTDNLGYLTPTAELSGYYDIDWNSGKKVVDFQKDKIVVFKIKSCSDQIKELGLDKRFLSFEEAIEAAKNAGFEVQQIKKDIQNLPGAILVHTETQKAQTQAKEADLNKWKNAKPCFVRFGKVPKNGRSYNHADNIYEEGVSVYYGERLPSGEARPIAKTPQQQSGIVAFQSEGYQLYIVTGVLLDNVGADGEPLLKNCRVWRKAK